MLSWRFHNIYSNLQSVIRTHNHVKHSNQSVKRINFSNVQYVKRKSLFHLVALINLLGIYNPFRGDTSVKNKKYWTSRTFVQLLEAADRLYNEEKYFEVYEMLNRIQFYQNVEVQWRICRTLYKLSCETELANGVRQNMIIEAFSLILQTLQLDDAHPEVHKWMAILLDARTSLDGAISKVNNALRIKYHMEKSLELNADDPAMLFMLGSWCYQMQNLSWLQKRIARCLCLDPPDVRVEEAYQYFLRAEQLKPRFFIGNIYMLAKCCYDMGYFYRARYYFKMASELPVHSDIERKHMENAKICADKLKNYDINLYSLQN